MKKSSSLEIFKLTIKSWTADKCPCRVWKYPLNRKQIQRFFKNSGSWLHLLTSSPQISICEVNEPIEFLVVYVAFRQILISIFCYSCMIDSQ